MCEEGQTLKTDSSVTEEFWSHPSLLFSFFKDHPDEIVSYINREFLRRRISDERRSRAIHQLLKHVTLFLRINNFDSTNQLRASKTCANLLIELVCDAIRQDKVGTQSGYEQRLLRNFVSTFIDCLHNFSKATRYKFVISARDKYQSLLTCHMLQCKNRRGGKGSLFLSDWLCTFVSEKSEAGLSGFEARLRIFHRLMLNSSNEDGISTESLLTRCIQDAGQNQCPCFGYLVEEIYRIFSLRTCLGSKLKFRILIQLVGYSLLQPIDQSEPSLFYNFSALVKWKQDQKMKQIEEGSKGQDVKEVSETLLVSSSLFTLLALSVGSESVVDDIAFINIAHLMIATLKSSETMLINENNLSQLFKSLSLILNASSSKSVQNKVISLISSLVVDNPFKRIFPPGLSYKKCLNIIESEMQHHIAAENVKCRTHEVCFLRAEYSYIIAVNEIIVPLLLKLLVRQTRSIGLSAKTIQHIYTVLQSKALGFNPVAVYTLLNAESFAQLEAIGNSGLACNTDALVEVCCFALKSVSNEKSSAKFFTYDTELIKKLLDFVSIISFQGGWEKICEDLISTLLNPCDVRVDDKIYTISRLLALDALLMAQAQHRIKPQITATLMIPLDNLIHKYVFSKDPDEFIRIFLLKGEVADISTTMETNIKTISNTLEVVSIFVLLRILAFKLSQSRKRKSRFGFLTKGEEIHLRALIPRLIRVSSLMPAAINLAAAWQQKGHLILCRCVTSMQDSLFSSPHSRVKDIVLFANLITSFLKQCVKDLKCDVGNATGHLKDEDKEGDNVSGMFLECDYMSMSDLRDAGFNIAKEQLERSIHSPTSFLYCLLPAVCDIIRDNSISTAVRMSFLKTSSQYMLNSTTVRQMMIPIVQNFISMESFGTKHSGTQAIPEALRITAISCWVENFIDDSETSLPFITSMILKILREIQYSKEPREGESRKTLIATLLAGLFCLLKGNRVRQPISVVEVIATVAVNKLIGDQLVCMTRKMLLNLFSTSRKCFSRLVFQQCKLSIPGRSNISSTSSCKSTSSTFSTLPLIDSCEDAIKEDIVRLAIDIQHEAGHENEIAHVESLLTSELVRVMTNEEATLLIRILSLFPVSEESKIGIEKMYSTGRQNILPSSVLNLLWTRRKA